MIKKKCVGAREKSNEALTTQVLPLTSPWTQTTTYVCYHDYAKLDNKEVIKNSFKTVW